MKFFCENLKKEFDLKIEYVSKDEVFRNYYTVLPPQNLLDDLLEDEQEQDDVRSLIDGFSGIQKDNNYTSRPFKYAQAFPEILREDFLRPFTSKNDGKYGIGRYGDGHGYGVFYAALEIETSIKEVLFHTLNDFHDRKKAMKEDYFIRDRKMIRIGFKGNLIDLTNTGELKDEITKESYVTCQSLGGQCSKNSVDALLTPSARSNGTCIPILNPKSINSFENHKSFVFNFQIIISKKDPSKIRVEEIKTLVFESSEIANFKRT
ncbi:MAG: RES family NAD+ phosphorylase [Bacteriovoracaceae bacterium]